MKCMERKFLELTGLLTCFVFKSAFSFTSITVTMGDANISRFIKRLSNNTTHCLLSFSLRIIFTLLLLSVPTLGLKVLRRTTRESVMMLFTLRLTPLFED